MRAPVVADPALLQRLVQLARGHRQAQPQLAEDRLRKVALGQLPERAQGLGDQVQAALQVAGQPPLLRRVGQDEPVQ